MTLSTGIIFLYPYTRKHVDQDDYYHRVFLHQSALLYTEALGLVIRKELPKLGAVTAKARFHTVSQIHRIDDIQVKIGKNNPLFIKVAGLVDQATIFPETLMEGITLLATATEEDTAALTDIFKKKSKQSACMEYKKNMSRSKHPLPLPLLRPDMKQVGQTTLSTILKSDFDYFNFDNID